MVSTKSRAINLLALLLISGTVLIVLLSTSGYFDPLPNAKPIWERELFTQMVAANSREVQWLLEDLPPVPYTIRLEAAYNSGEPDSAYGLLLGQENLESVVVVSPVGYTAVWLQTPGRNLDDADFILPWQTWPHVNTGDQVNDLAIIVDDDKTSIRLNGEYLLETTDMSAIDKVGIFAESYGEDVTINFQQMELIDGGRGDERKAN